MPKDQEEKTDVTAIAGPGAIKITGKKADVSGMNIKIVRPPGRPKKPVEDLKPRQVAHYIAEYGISAAQVKYPELKLRTLLDYDERYNKK